MTETGSKLGVIGGTFDPIHFGHLRAAEVVAENLNLDQIMFIPAAKPPHRGRAPAASFGHRLEMVRLAVADRPGFIVSDREGLRSGPSYTVETLTEVQEEFGRLCKLFFITGLDAFFEIHTWKRYHCLFELADFVIVSRPGPDPTALGDYILGHVGADYRWHSERHVFEAPSRRPIHYVSMIRLEISSTKLRNLMAERNSVRYLTTDKVRRYIADNCLYLGHLDERRCIGDRPGAAESRPDY